MASRSSRETEEPRASSNLTSKPAWLALTSRFLCPWPTIASEAGRHRSSAISIYTGRKACSSTHAGKWLPAVGPIRARAALTWDSLRRASDPAQILHAAGRNALPAQALRRRGLLAHHPLLQALNDLAGSMLIEDCDCSKQKKENRNETTLVDLRSDACTDARFRRGLGSAGTQ